MTPPNAYPELLSPKVVATLLQQKFLKDEVKLIGIKPMALDNSSSILVTLTAASGASNIGHFRFLLDFNRNGKPEQADVVIKVKPHGESIAQMLEGLAAAHGSILENAYKEGSALTGFLYSHEKELHLSTTYGDAEIFPEIYGTLPLSEHNLFLIMMEYLGEKELIDSVITPELWTDAHIKAALDQAAQWHASRMNKTNDRTWPDAPSVENKTRLIPLYTALWKNASYKLPDLLSNEEYALILSQIPAAGELHKELEAFPKSQIHNDMNPRNSCFRRNGDQLTFVLYDWELSTVHLPHYDAVEFLCFVLDEDRYDLRESYLEYYRERIEKWSGLTFEPAAYRRSCYLLHLDFCFLRLGMYLMAHALSPYPFLPRVVKSCMNGINSLSKAAS